MTPTGQLDVALYGHRLAAPGATGIGRYTTELIRHLIQLDAQDICYRIISSREPDSPEWFDSTMPWQQLTLPRKLLHLAWASLESPRLDRLTRRPDVLHVLYPSTPVPSAAPTVVTVQDVMPLEHPDWYGRAETWAFRRAIRSFDATGALFIAPSTFVAGKLATVANLDPERVSVIPDGVSDEFRLRTPPPIPPRWSALSNERPYLVAVGAIEARKNLRVLLSALAALGDGRPSLVFIGPERDGGELAAAVRDRGLEHSVIMTGFLPGSEAVALVANAAGLLHPSLDEGFGLTPLEAMAAGVPTAVSCTGSLPEIVGDASLLVEPHDVEGWSAAIRSLLEPAVGESLRRAGLDQAERYSWARVARLTAEVHRKAATATPGD